MVPTELLKIANNNWIMNFRKEFTSILIEYEQGVEKGNPVNSKHYKCALASLKKTIEEIELRIELGTWIFPKEENETEEN